ncbi:MAG: hypothetical protein K6F00_09235, partial [Lachnospiraceae bacterium]|nr:hypothetical protein [Lachnospiraceae bacterium]
AIFEICDRIQNCKITDADEAIDELEDAECYLPEGKEIKPVQVKVNSYLGIEVRTPLLDGDYLETYVGNSDYGPQAGVVYVSKEGDLLDLAMVEQKQGEYAKRDGESGEDISIYTYADPLSEDYTSKDRVSKADIDDALDIENERES